MGNKKIRIPLSPSVLERNLQFPEDWEIIGCAWDFEKGQVILYVEGESLEPVQEGFLIPEGYGIETVARGENGAIISRKFEWKI